MSIKKISFFSPERILLQYSPCNDASEMLKIALDISICFNTTLLYLRSAQDLHFIFWADYWAYGQRNSCNWELLHCSWNPHWRGKRGLILFIFKFCTNNHLSPRLFIHAQDSRGNSLPELAWESFVGECLGKELLFCPKNVKC